MRARKTSIKDLFAITKRALLLCLLLLFMSCSMVAGKIIGDYLWPLEPITTIVEIPVITERIVEVETEKIVEVEVKKTVEVPVEVLVEKEVPIALTNWVDEEELKAFLAMDNTDEMVILVANSKGEIQFGGWCEDRALQLINNAMEQGRQLFFVPLHPSEYYKWYGKSSGGQYHAIAGAIVGDNEFWYIEPSTDKTWLALYLD